MHDGICAIGVRNRHSADTGRHGQCRPDRKHIGNRIIDIGRRRTVSQYHEEFPVGTLESETSDSVGRRRNTRSRLSDERTGRRVIERRIGRHTGSDIRYHDIRLIRTGHDNRRIGSDLR